MTDQRSLFADQSSRLTDRCKKRLLILLLVSIEQTNGRQFKATLWGRETRHHPTLCVCVCVRMCACVCPSAYVFGFIFVCSSARVLSANPFIAPAPSLPSRPPPTPSALCAPLQSGRGRLMKQGLACPSPSGEQREITLERLEEF